MSDNVVVETLEQPGDLGRAITKDRDAVWIKGLQPHQEVLKPHETLDHKMKSQEIWMLAPVILGALTLVVWSAYFWFLDGFQFEFPQQEADVLPAPGWPQRHLQCRLCDSAGDRR